MTLVGIGTPPQPPTRRLVCPLPPVSGGRGTLAGEKGVGRVPIPTRGIHCGTLYMYVLCVCMASGTIYRVTCGFLIAATSIVSRLLLTRKIFTINKCFH
jgi:hypothetical protein